MEINEYDLVKSRSIKKYGDKAEERVEKAEATKNLILNPVVSQGLFETCFSNEVLFPPHPYYKDVGGDNEKGWLDLSVCDIKTGEINYLHSMRSTIKNKNFFKIGFRIYKQVKYFPTHRGLLIYDWNGERVQWVFIPREVLEECYELHIKEFPEQAGVQNLKSILYEFKVPTSKCILLGEYISPLQDRYLPFPNNDIVFPNQYLSLNKFFA